MNIFATIGLCLAVFCGGGDEKDPQRLEVRVKPSTSVRGLDVTIGELCDITPEGAAALAIAQVKFGPAPGNGHSRTISRTEIVQAIAAAGRDVGLLKFEGANETVVQPILTDVLAQDLLEAATAALQAVLAIEGGDVEYEAPNRLRLVQAPPGRSTQELTAKLRGDHTAPNGAVIDVEIVVDGQLFKKVPVQFKLTRYQPMLKTTGVIRAGTPLGPENVTLSREPMAQSTKLFLESIDQVVGLIAARNLQSGQRLMLGDTALPAAIHRGDVVTVVLTQGRVKVTARAMANEDAPLGGRIKLTNVQSRAQMVGIVAAAGLVVVQQ